MIVHPPALSDQALRLMHRERDTGMVLSRSDSLECP